MSAEKKKAHIDLALQSQTLRETMDTRFNYEPMLSAHPQGILKPFAFLGKTMRVPIWISSMTGGTEAAMLINRNLARVCNEFGLGMGLGSCRILLEDNLYPEHFLLRKYIGDEVPFYANLGIVQIGKALANNTVDRITEMIGRLQADGLMIHVNPLQEWLQPEGEVMLRTPIEIIKEFIERVDFPVIVKEVGQGMGPESLRQLMSLPLEAVEFAAFGGTNFASLELQRSNQQIQQMLKPLSLVGNDAYDMLDSVNKLVSENPDLPVKQIIISGGIKNFLDGYYFIRKSQVPAIYGQASMFLRYAREDYETLREFTLNQIRGLEIAHAYLTIREDWG
jgi:isopentenyl-diphosphate delta-isomerase